MSFWQRPDVLQQIQSDVDFERLRQIRLERAGWIHSKHWGEKTRSLEFLAESAELLAPLEVNCSQDIVRVDSLQRPNALQAARLKAVAESLKPWRKGPFQLFDLLIDTEWRSNLKWDRISAAIGNVEGLNLLDVGCGNGYYMFRASAGNPQLVVGLDPSVPFLLQFEMIQHFARIPALQLELLGAEHLPIFSGAFDVVLCMGILYHQKNPVQILRDLWQTLKPGGIAIIESQIIPGSESVALFPQDRYAKARNVYFVPTATCLIHWIQRAGFQEIQLLDASRTTPDEQRKTDWSTNESLVDFLDPDDPLRTVEGYPAPHRAAIRAVK